MLAVVLLFVPAFIAARLRPPPPGAAQALEWATLTLALPALILGRLAPARLTAQAVTPGLVAWTCLAVSACLVLVISRIGRWPRPTVGALLLIVPIGNTSFFGLPAIRSIVGERAVPTVVLYDQLGTSLAVATYAAVIVALYKGSEVPSVRQMVGRVVRFPALIAIAIALVIAAIASVRGVAFEWPGSVHTTLELAGMAVSPFALWAVALRSAALDLRWPSPHLLWALGLKMLVVPLIVVSAVIAVGLHRGLEMNVSLLESTMPPSVAACVLAMDAGLDPDLATRAVSLGLLIGFVSVPLWGRALGF